MRATRAVLGLAGGAALGVILLSAARWIPAGSDDGYADFLVRLGSLVLAAVALWLVPAYRYARSPPFAAERVGDRIPATTGREVHVPVAIDLPSDQRPSSGRRDLGQVVEWELQVAAPYGALAFGATYPVPVVAGPAGDGGAAGPVSD